MKRAAAKNGRSAVSKKHSVAKRSAAAREGGKVPSRTKSSSKRPDASRGYDGQKTAEALWDLADYFIL